MGRIVLVLSFLLNLLSISLGLHAEVGTKGINDNNSQKSIRLFLTTGETLDFNSADIDSITTNIDFQCIWQAGTCQSFAIESIDSIWYISPALRITTKDVNFGKVAIGNKKTTEVTMTNTGNYKESYFLFADGVFKTSGSGDSYIIAAGQSINIDISFLPTDSTEYKGNLLVSSSAVNDGLMKLPLMGIGVAVDSLEEDVILPPVEKDFLIVLPEEESIESFSDFKIVNFNGEFPTQIPTNARRIRKIKRAGATYNVFSSPAIVSSDGLQIHSFVDAQNNPYLFSISLPDEKPEISFKETAISLLLTYPDLIPTNQAEYRNAVEIITRLDAFSDFMQQVANAYYEARKKNQSPDYSTLNALPIITELFEAIKDNSEHVFSGVSLKDLNVSPISAKFRLHNDFQRFILAYPSRVKMADNNLIVVEQEDALTLLDLLNQLLDKLNRIADNVMDETDNALHKELSEMGITLEDKEFIEDLKDWIKEIEDEEIEEMSQNPAMNEVFKLAMPYILNSSKAKYWTIVWDYLLDDFWFGFKHEESIFETESDDIDIDFNGYDKIFLDIYGLGLPKGKSWNDYTQEEQSRIMIACLWGSYHDVIEPLWKMITSGIGTYKASKGYKFDFRYGARKYPECAFVAKLYQNFKKDKKNVQKLAENAENGDIKAILIQFSKFAVEQLLTIPKESDNVEDKRTYTNLIYNIWKKYTNTSATTEEFRKRWKGAANAILSKVNVVFKTIDAGEAAVNAIGGINALLQSNLKETIVINKYDKPYIEVIEPNYTPATLNQTIQFRWKTYKADNYGKFLYDLVLAAETPNNFTKTTVLSNFDGESCNVDLSTISEISNADRIVFQLIAHDDRNTSTIYAKTDYLTLFSRFSDNVPVFYDLGLPSGTLWASCNLGATQAEDFGNYYAWGELDTNKDSFSWKNYKYCKGTSKTLTKYCTKASYGYNSYTDAFFELQGSDDPLSREYGFFYGIPTKEDWEELITMCKWTWLNNGALVKGPSGDVIFLPSAGYWNERNHYDENSKGYYWSSTLDQTGPDEAWSVSITKGKPSDIHYCRCYGMSIRPVMHTYDSQKFVTSITLSKTSLSLKVNDTKILTATVLPEDARNKTLAWSSSDESIASVDQTGKVIAVADGSCTIVCSATDGSGVYAKCQVTVTSGTIPDPDGNEAYVMTNQNDRSITFYYDDKRDTRENPTYNLNIEDGYGTYLYHYSLIGMIDDYYVKVVFDSSFAKARPIKTRGWFANLHGLTTIEGLQYLNTSNVTDMSGMFYYSSLTSLNLSSFDTSNVKDMEKMFCLCSSLTSLDLSSFDTSNVTDMHDMFSGCSSLTSLDLSGFDTSIVEDMTWMFSGCSSLTSLDLSSFDTSKVVVMTWMFRGCSSLTSLDLSSFDTSNVTDMSNMFDYCHSLTSLDLSSFDTSNVTDMDDMFWGCSSLTSLDLRGFDTSNVIDMNKMFEGCSSLTSLDLSGFDTSNVTDMHDMFSGCSSLTSLDLSSFDTSNVTHMGDMFENCSSLTSLDLSSFDTSNVTHMSGMFEDCSSLPSLDLSSFDTSNVEYIQGMFADCSSLTSLDLSNFNTSNSTCMHRMFEGCSFLTSLDLSSFDTSNVEFIQGMFADCSSLTSLDLSNFNTSNVTDMMEMFQNCHQLKTIYAGNNWNTDKVDESNSMFEGCFELKGGMGTSYNAYHVDKDYARIDGGTERPGYFTDSESVPSSINVIPTSIDFGIMKLGSTKTDYFTVYNTGEGTLMFHLENYGSPGERFYVQEGGEEFVLKAGESKKFTVVCTIPKDCVDYGGGQAIYIYSNASNADKILLSVGVNVIHE